VFEPVIECRKGITRESGTPWLRGSPHAIAFTSAICSGGERRGRPARCRSSRPARRCSKNRFRQRPTTSAAVSSRRAVSAFVSPSAAQRIIFARCTTLNGNE
jgi:hypothetical protein